MTSLVRPAVEAFFKAQSTRFDPAILGWSCCATHQAGGYGSHEVMGHRPVLPIHTGIGMDLSR